MTKKGDAGEAEAARTALRESLERAHELIVEARHQIGDPKPEAPQPDPA